MVDFTLSPTEKGVQQAARTFATTHLAGAKKAYSTIESHSERFQSVRPIYHEAVLAGLIKGQVPTPLGGTSGSLIEAAILVEEMYAVEPAASLVIFGTGLGLTPLILAFRPELGEFLEPFLSGEGEPLASLVFSEPGGVVCLVLMLIVSEADYGCRRIGLSLVRRDCRLQLISMEMSGC